jgi:hypothetical protein
MRFCRISSTSRVIVLLALGCQSLVEGQSGQAFDGFKLVDKTGNISKPANYQDEFRMMGAYAVIDPKGNELHYTYASPGAIESYRRNKKFADGSVLEGGLRNRARSADDRRCELGLKHQSLVRPHQRRQRPLSEQSAMGRRLGLGSLQIRRSRQAGGYGL